MYLSTLQKLPPLRSRGKELNTSPQAFGELRRSDDVLQNGAILRARMQEDGYLFLPGALNRNDVLAARAICLERLATQGWLDPSQPVAAAIAAPNRSAYFMPNLSRDNAPLLSVLYDGPMITLFTEFLGGEVRHFDFTWMRAVTPGNGTAPHCDVVYMGRGTQSGLFTAWTPLGDVPISIGGLMLLEHSHRKSAQIQDYLSRDVDAYCQNSPNAEAIRTGKMDWDNWDGALSQDPVELRNALGGRWLTAEYRAGDVLLFSMRTVHASLDNSSNQMRLSSDTRYQLAAEPIDERWIGESPIGHGLAGKRELIC